MTDNNQSDLIEKKFKELDELKKKVDQLVSLSNLGDEIKNEIESYKILRSKGVEIKHLEKKLSDELYPKRSRKIHGQLLQSDIQEAIDKTTSSIKAAKFLGISYPTFKKYSKKYNIHAPKGWPVKKGICTRGPTDPKKGKFPINDILDGKFPDFPIHRLKDKLIRSGIKKPECEQCGYRERRLTDGKLPLLLNFEDNNNHNHKLENMRLLCYNCTFTCGKGYISHGPKKFDPDIMQDSKKIQKTRF